MIFFCSFRRMYQAYLGFPGVSEVKESACNVGDLGSIPGLGRSPGEGNGNPLQYSCLENPMDRGAWWATVHGVTKSRTRLSDFASLSLPSGLLIILDCLVFLCLVLVFFGHTACGILVPQPRIKPVPPVVEAQSLNH